MYSYVFAHTHRHVYLPLFLAFLFLQSFIKLQLEINNLIFLSLFSIAISIDLQAAIVSTIGKTNSKVLIAF